MDRQDDAPEASEQRKSPLDQTPEERARARKRLEEVLEHKGPVTLQTPLGRLQVGRGNERGFDDDEVPEALTEMREIWQAQGHLGSRHDPTMRMPSVFKEESADPKAAMSWGDMATSGESTYDPGEAIRRAREAFRATLRREGKLRE
jgi:hypothetical protein